MNAYLHQLAEVNLKAEEMRHEIRPVKLEEQQTKKTKQGVATWLRPIFNRLAKKHV